MACECITETKKMKTFFHCRRGRIFSGGGVFALKLVLCGFFGFFFFGCCLGFFPLFLLGFEVVRGCFLLFFSYLMTVDIIWVFF